MKVRWFLSPMVAVTVLDAELGEVARRYPRLFLPAASAYLEGTWGEWSCACLTETFALVRVVFADGAEETVVHAKTNVGERELVTEEDWAWFRSVYGYQRRWEDQP